MSLLSFEVN